MVSIALVSALMGCLVLSLPAAAQDTPEEPPASSAEDGTAEPEEGESAEAAEPEKIPLNLNKAKIEHVMKFLSEKTGKVVVKTKEVSAEITIVSPAPVTPERAVELICHALRLEGVAAVERDGVINLIPLKKEMGLCTSLPWVPYVVGH